MCMNVKTRLKNYITHQGMSVSQFEQECGLANAYIQNIRQMITPDKLSLILARFPKLNVDWLLTGRGTMEHSEMPIEHPFDCSHLYNEYSHLLECALYLARPTNKELSSLLVSIASSIEYLREQGQTYKHLESLYKRVLRLQNWAIK